MDDARHSGGASEDGGHEACIAQIFRASNVTSYVSPAISFPRPAALLAERLQRTRDAAAPIPCTTCSHGCTVRSFAQPPCGS